MSGPTDGTSGSRDDRMITTLALALFGITLLVIIIRLERELWQAREQWKFEHEIAVILQGLARREWRIAQAWKERAQGDGIPEAFLEAFEEER